MPVRSAAIRFGLIPVVNDVSFGFGLGDDVVVEVIAFGPVGGGDGVGIVDVFPSVIVENDVRSERGIDEVLVFLSFEIRRLLAEVFDLGSLVVGV